MEFQAPTVQHKKNPKARLSALGAVLLVVAVFLAMMDGYEKYAMWTFGVSILIFLLGVVLAKGDLTDVEVSQTIQLVVSSGGIRIGGDFYQMGGVKNIDFDVEGYAGMNVPKLSLPAGAESDGMDNCLRFEYMGQKFECPFYLGGPQHVQQIGLLFRSFYEQRIPFVERRGLYQTFMLQPMSEKELEDAKRSYGYA